MVTPMTLQKGNRGGQSYYTPSPLPLTPLRDHWEPLLHPWRHFNKVSYHRRWGGEWELEVKKDQYIMKHLELSFFFCNVFYLEQSFPGSMSGKEPVWQCRRLKRCGFHPWIRKLPWRRWWQPTPVFLPGESHGQRRPGGLQSLGSFRVGHQWGDLAYTLLKAAIHTRENGFRLA